MAIDHDDGLSLFKPPPLHDTTTRIVIEPSSVWRAAWAVVGVLAVVGFIQFFASGASGALVVIVMAFFFALAVEPMVLVLTRVMPRAAATAVVMLATVLFLIGFFWLFGGLLFDQLAALVTALPGVATSLLDWVNATFDTNYDVNSLLSKLNLSTENVAGWASQIAGGVLGVVSGIFGAAFNAFSFGFLAFYLSAGMPRLRNWFAGLFPPRRQVVVLTVWQLMLTKVGGYVGARLVLAMISSTASGIFMWAIGMPYWLPLALWTGLIAQFVPNVGTYIAIVLPVVVGLTSDDSMDGVWVLLFALAYQQVENLTIEPRISARAVDVHPAVSFASATIGAQLFGVIGATLGVPVAATLMAIFDIYKHRYEVTGDIEAEAAAVVNRSLAKEQAAAQAESEEEPAEHLDPDGPGH